MNCIRTILICTFLCFCGAKSHSQEIQWASIVLAQSGAYENNDWSATRALGEPDAFPYGEMNPNAFRLKTENGSGSLVLGFSTPQTARQVIIAENYAPGRIRKVTLYDQNNVPYVILDESYPENKKFKFLAIPVPATRNLYVRVEIVVDATKNRGWAQIDAVGISDSSDPSLFRQLLDKYGLTQEYLRMEKAQVKRNLGHFINSKFDENKPVISPDGNLIYFGRRFYPGNIGGRNDIQDIYFSQKMNGEWSEPRNLDQPINNRNPNGVTSISADGNRIYLINEYFRDGTFKNGFSYSDRQSGSWQFPRNLVIERYQNRSLYLDFALSINEDVMILAIETKDTKGDQDLYVSFYLGNDTWSEPKNLGATINTAKAEYAPFLAPDGTTLYFSSEGHGGFGGADIFYTKRLDDTWEVWSQPKNLGTEINTSGMDAYFSIPVNSEIGYYVSDQGSIGGSRDIFEIQLKPEFLPDPIVAFQGTVQDMMSGRPVQAQVNVRSPNESAKRNAINSSIDSGQFKVILVQNSAYTIEVEAEGYEKLVTQVGPYRFSGDTVVTALLNLVPRKAAVASFPANIKTFDIITGNEIDSNVSIELVLGDTEAKRIDIQNKAGSIEDFRLEPDEVAQIKLFAKSEGYLPTIINIETWELKDGIYEFNLSLIKAPAPIQSTSISMSDVPQRPLGLRSIAKVRISEPDPLPELISPPGPLEKINDPGLVAYPAVVSVIPQKLALFDIKASPELPEEITPPAVVSLLSAPILQPISGQGFYMPSSISKINIPESSQPPLLPSFLTLFITTLDEGTRKPVEANIAIYDSLGSSVMAMKSDTVGVLELKLEFGRSFEIKVDAPGFNTAAMSIKTGDPDSSEDTLRQTILLSAIPEAQIFYLRLVDAQTLKSITTTEAWIHVHYGSDSLSKVSFESQTVDKVAIKVFEGATKVNVLAKADEYNHLFREISVDEKLVGSIVEFSMSTSPERISMLQMIPILPNPSIDLKGKVKPVEIEEATELEHLISINGLVVDEITDKPISNVSVNYQVILGDSQYEGVLIGAAGDFYLELHNYSKVKLQIAARGYFRNEYDFTLSDSVDYSRLMFKLKPVPKGEAVEIPNLLFIIQSSEIAPSSFPVLDSIASVLNGNPELEILLSGHTDAIGDKELNYKLSLERASSVKDYLVAKGILPDRIRVEAFGGTRPIASSAREETRRLNRRVELTIIKD